MKLSKNILNRCVELLGKYKYVLIVVAVGLLLILWPSGQKTADETEAPVMQTTDFDLSEIENKMEALLSKAEGVGRIEVVLALRTGIELVYADENNISTSQSLEAGQLAESEDSSENQLVIVADSAGNESPVVVKRIYPEYLGALVVCDGADNPSVKLKITNAITALTGIGADSITIVKMGK